MSLARFDHPSEAARWRDERAGSVGFVPTMGALHAGHLALVQRSVEACDHTVVSVFVNPLQFDEPEDLARYPRDLEGDSALLDEVRCDAVFTGTLEQFFPESAGGDVALRDPGPCAAGLEGAHRGGHFAGVATIVARLFELTRPDVAFFGAKDFQQSLVVRDLAAALGGPAVEVCPTVREADGLALSSRNARLGSGDRARALALSRALFAARESWSGGERGADALCAVMDAVLAEARAGIDYAEVRDPERWTAARPRGDLARAQALIAARVGAVRLIDNLRLDA